MHMTPLLLPHHVLQAAWAQTNPAALTIQPREAMPLEKQPVTRGNLHTQTRFEQHWVLQPRTTAKRCPTQPRGLKDASPGGGGCACCMHSRRSIQPLPVTFTVQPSVCLSCTKQYCSMAATSPTCSAWVTSTALTWTSPLPMSHPRLTALSSRHRATSTISSNGVTHRHGTWCRLMTTEMMPTSQTTAPAAATTAPAAGDAGGGHMHVCPDKISYRTMPLPGRLEH